MLPARSRVHRPGEFRAVVRHGVRAGRPTVVVHVSRTVDLIPARELSTESVDNSSVPVDAGAIRSEGDASMEALPRVGFIVSKAVGNAVTRNRVKRRLRHLSRGLLASTPEHTLVVVRALPGASSCPDALPGELDAAWTQALRKLDRVRAVASGTGR